MDPREKRRQELIAMNVALLEKIKAESRRLTDEEKVEFDDRVTEIDALADELNREKKMAELERDSRESEGTKAGSAFIAPGDGNDGSGDDGDRRQEPAAAPAAGALDYGARAAQVSERLGPPRPGANNPWRSFGEFMHAVMRGSDPGTIPDRRLVEINPEQRAAGMNEAIGSEGGFLVQTDFANQLLERIYEAGVLGGRCFRFPISAAANGISIPAIVESSRADGSRAGGVQAFWESEAAEKTSSKPAVGKVELKLKKLIGLCYATDELLQDTNALGAVISRLFSQEMGFKVDDSLVNGTGAGQPLGVLNAPCLVTVAKETGQVAATIVSDNIVKMWSRMWARSRPNAVWLINQDVEPELYTMGITVGTGGSTIFMPAGGLSQSPYSTLFGRPIIPIEQCETLGTVGDIILADYSQYALAEKGGLQAATSIHVRFIYDETAFRFVLRVDGQPWWSAALTPYKGGATKTLSPFVALATRA